MASTGTHTHLVILKQGLPGLSLGLSHSAQSPPLEGVRVRGVALHHDGMMQIDQSRWWVLRGLTAPMAIHFGKDHIFLIADPQISTVLWLTLVESKANFKCENIIEEQSKATLCCNTNSGR